jgi:diadenosine tetraphosphate (Ap4A) HIT family hydrolase
MKIHRKLEEDTIFVVELGLSDVRLMNNQQYPWLILTPRVDNAVELSDLTGQQRYQLMDEISLVSETLTEIYAPDKLNIATLGNIVRQLHIHAIVRYRTDPTWPAPVWGAPTTPYSPSNLERTLAGLMEKLGSSKLPNGSL